MESRLYCDDRSIPSMEMGEVGRGVTVPEAGELLSKESRANVDKNVPSIAMAAGGGRG